MIKPSISFYTLGCRSNQSETATLQNCFEQEGCRVRPFGEPTDIVVVNTCTVTSKSDSDARKLVRRIARENPRARIALIGCQAQLQKEILVSWPNVRWVIGTAQKMRLASILSSPESPHKTPQVITTRIEREYFHSPVFGIDREHTRANIKIQDGCDSFCSFCEVPYARGPARSRDFLHILAEAKALVAAGHKELVVTGINVGAYRDGSHSLEDVLKSLLDIRELPRLRISSIEPIAVSKKILNLMCENDRFCRHLHIPLQSGNNAILRAMRRPYTAETFAALIQDVAAVVPRICVGTDVIVGFPKESEGAFKMTQQLLEELPIHYLHVFSYSDRKKAKSHSLPDKIPPCAIKKRSQILHALGDQKRKQFFQSHLGQTVPVLFEQQKNDLWAGLTGNFIPVRVKSRENLHNQIRSVRLIKIQGLAILGRIENKLLGC